MEMTQEERLTRLNALAAASRERALTAEEQAEQKRLREEYRLAFRQAFRGVLENTFVQQPDGTRVKLQRKDGGSDGKHTDH